MLDMEIRMVDIIIVGAGGCGREVANWIDDINKIDAAWNILGFLDDNLNGDCQSRCQEDSCTYDDGKRSAVRFHYPSEHPYLF